MLKTTRHLITAAMTAALLQAVAIPTALANDLRLVEPGTLTVGYSPYGITFDVVDGKPTGLFGLIIEAAAERMGLKLKPQPFDFPGLIPALQSGRVDVIGNLSITQPRSQIMYFATPVFFQPETLAVRKGESIGSWEEAAERGLTLSTQAGLYYLGPWEEMGINIHTFDNPDACLLDVVNHGSDGCAIGALSLIYMQSQQPDSPATKALESQVTSGPRIAADVNSFGISKNRPDLAAALTDEFTAMWRDGTMQKIYAEFFKDGDYEQFLDAPSGAGLYLPGPWEEGVSPPPSDIDVAALTTVSPGVLKVGVLESSPLLSLEDGSLVGPEGNIVAKVAAALNLKVEAVSIDNVGAALSDGIVDVVAGGIAQSADLAKDAWFTMPVGFSPDYIYVKPGSDGAFPSYGSWEAVAAAGGSLAVLADDARLEQVRSSGATVVTVETATEGLLAVANGEVAGFVGTTPEFLAAVSSTPELVSAGLGWGRNVNLHSKGQAYAWAVKPDNVQLINALDAMISKSWTDRSIALAYADAFPGADPTAILAPGPTSVGTSYGASKDYQYVSTFVSGPWLQRKAN